MLATSERLPLRPANHGVDEPRLQLPRLSTRHTPELLQRPWDNRILRWQ